MQAIQRMNGVDDTPSVAGEIMAAGAGMMQVRSTYATAIAVQRPRVLAAVVASLLMEADLGGASFYYGWGAGKDSIEGPSVKLALAAARCWGNCAVELLPVVETATSWIFTAAFVDLETGFTMSRQFRQSKAWKVFGKHDEERKADIRFQIGQSKAIRNVVLNALPSGLIDRAMEKAKQGVRDSVEKFIKENGLPKAIEAILKALTKCGVSEDRVVAKMGVADRKALDVDHIVTLRGDLEAIQGGRDWPDDLFPPLEADKKADDVNARFESPAPTSDADKTIADKAAQAQATAAAKNAGAGVQQNPPSTDSQLDPETELKEAHDRRFASLIDMADNDKAHEDVIKRGIARVAVGKKVTGMPWRLSADDWAGIVKAVADRSGYFAYSK